VLPLRSKVPDETDQGDCPVFAEAEGVGCGTLGDGFEVGEGCAGVRMQAAWRSDRAKLM
jgi:hypothetical protein